ncbi:hypothetical protein ACA910_009700 [Epithemia clementina (nom. ined.)]
MVVVHSFSLQPTTTRQRTTQQQHGFVVLDAQRSSSSSSSSSSRGNPYARRSSSQRPPADVRSKRQERVGQLVRTELSQLLHAGHQIRVDAPLEAELRQRISVVSANVSPDLRQARIAVSIRSSLANKNKNNNKRITATKTATTAAAAAAADPRPNQQDDDALDDDNDDAPVLLVSSSNNAKVDQRRAYAWLVQNTKAIRHALAQRMRHLKTCPNLTFVQVNVGAAVDVMYLIDQVSSGQTVERPPLWWEGGTAEAEAAEWLEDDDDEMELDDKDLDMVDRDDRDRDDRDLGNSKRQTTNNNNNNKKSTKTNAALLEDWDDENDDDDDWMDDETSQRLFS